ncbi:MAG: DUF6100 family protein [Clostridiales bacterium]|jgi:hypothetical protein|nr:DUF6100 family protein [Clostridiales bacterium]
MDTALENRRYDKLYEHLASTAGHIERMTRDLRETLICFHGDLQLTDALEPYQPYPLAREVEIDIEDGSITVKMPAMLPFPADGPVYYLHELLDKALDTYVKEKSLPRPFFTERAAVVFMHHYAEGAQNIRHLRDYDNVEHRCVTNVLAAHLLWGDNPKCIVSMDVLAPGKINFTEVRVMPISVFREFVMSEKLTFNL